MNAYWFAEERFECHCVLECEASGRARETEHVVRVDQVLSCLLKLGGGRGPEGEARVRIAYYGIGARGTGRPANVQGQSHSGE